MNPKIDFSLYLRVAAESLQLGLFIAFVVSCYFLWRLTCRISMGHDLIGRCVVLILFTAMLLMAFGPDRVVFFRCLVYGSLSAWSYFNIWYFSKYPLPSELLKELRNPALPGSLVFIPKAAFFRFLLRDSPELKRPWWFSNTFRNIGVACIGLMLLAYGFTQTINAYSWGYKLAAVAQKQASLQTQKVAVAGKVGRDSLAAELRKKNLLDSIRYTSTKGDRKRYFELLTELKNDIRAKPVVRVVTSQPLIIVAPTPKGLPPTSFTLPGTEHVKPPATLPAKPRKVRQGKYSFTEEEQEDAQPVARSNPPEN